MVDDFVAAVGKGVIRHLILDRGFIDGAAIGRAKREHGIDTTIGVRSNMDIYRDAVGIAALPETAWRNHARPLAAVEPPIRRHPVDARHAEILQRREAARQATLARQRAELNEPVPAPPQQWIARIPGTTSFDQCPVPLDVVLCTTGKNPNAEDSWAIMTTDPTGDAAAPVDRYALRTAIEERHRHIKCFWNIADFPSTDFALVANQVVFTLMTYSLLQQQLLRKGRRALNKATKSRLLERLVPVAENIMVFTDNYYACFDTYDYTRMVMAVPEAARARLAARLNQRQSELYQGNGPPA
jgi:hypothetical protein